MISRRLILLASVLVSAALYAALYAVSPSILLLQANAAREDLSHTFKVDLYEGPLPQQRQEEATPEDTLASRPGSVRDLLDEETKDLPLADDVEPESPPEEVQPVAEVLERNHDIARDEQLIAGIEAQLVAIPEEHARDKIEVARRFVRDNESRLVASDDLPVLAGGDSTADHLTLPGPGGIGGGVAGGAGGGSGAASESNPPSPAQEQPSWPLLSPDADRASAPVPGLPDETVIARETVRREVEAASPYESMDALVGSAVTTYVDPKTGEGFFELRIQPNDDSSIPALPRDVTFVIDASNSIIQRKLDLTVRGLNEALQSLRPEDRFNIIVFRDTAQAFRASVVPATRETLAEAREFLDGLESRGSTDVYGAVRPVLDRPPREGAPGIVMVISDGRPTEGNLEGRALINALSEENRYRNSVYTFGGGNTVNQYLMDLLAYRNRGVSYIAPRIDDIDEDLPRFFRRFQDALLVDLRADYGKIDKATIFPQRLPDFYRGRVVTVYGKFDPAQDRELVVRLEGRAGDEQKEIVLKADLSAASRGDRSIAEGWAFEKSYHLIGEITRVGEQRAILDELQRLSNNYGVRTSYTP